MFFLACERCPPRPSASNAPTTSRPSAPSTTPFGQPAEGAVLDAIRAACPDILSLVAEEESEVVGHILFSPASATGPDGPVVGMPLCR